MKKYIFILIIHSISIPVWATSTESKTQQLGTVVPGDKSTYIFKNSKTLVSGKIILEYSSTTEK